MSATMLDMELTHADNLTPDQLMVDDLIKISDDLVNVIRIESDAMGDIYFVAYQDEFGEKDVIEFAHTDLIPLYVFVEDE